VLEAGEPSPVTVTIGLSDGRMTEILDGELSVGQQVLVDVVESAS
jgi:multidrug efflux pump subunit AcrA (membrane-fusion protein)